MRPCVLVFIILLFYPKSSKCGFAPILSTITTSTSSYSNIVTSDILDGSAEATTQNLNASSSSCVPQECTKYCLSINSTEGNCADQDCVCKIDDDPCDNIDCGEHCWRTQKQRGYCFYSGCNCIGDWDGSDDNNQNGSISTTMPEIEKSTSSVENTTDTNAANNQTNLILNQNESKENKSSDGSPFQSFSITDEGDIIINHGGGNSSNTTSAPNDPAVMTGSTVMNALQPTQSPDSDNRTDISSNTISPFKRNSKNNKKSGHKKHKHRKKKKKHNNKHRRRHRID